jgi:hypothetical protein
MCSASAVSLPKSSETKRLTPALFGQRVDDLRLLGEARMTEMTPPWPLILWNELLL